MHVKVTDSAGQVLVDFPYQVGARVSGYEMQGAKGAWTLQVTFEDAKGDGMVVLSG